MISESSFDPKIGLCDKPCSFCGAQMVQVGVRRLYCDECQKHQGWRQIKHRYGLDLPEYVKLLESQDGLCAICGRECAEGKRLAVDHCHRTGRIRGLLCSRCNTSIGKFEEDPQLLRRAIEYLERFSTDLG